MDIQITDHHVDLDNGYCSGEDIIYDPLSPQKEKKPRKTYKQVRPKVQLEWTHEEILQLINAVQERPTLWDISSPAYKLPKTSAWQDSADYIGERTADDCKAQWSNLRVSFKTNLSKSRKNKSGSAAGGNIVVWKYFNAMLFLDLNETSQSSKSISSVTQSSEGTNLLLVENEVPAQRKRDKKISSIAPQSSSSDVFKEMAAKAICTLAEKSNEKDQFDVFGTHVAAEFRSLELPKALLAKRKLARALVDIMDEVQS